MSNVGREGFLLKATLRSVTFYSALMQLSDLKGNSALNQPAVTLKLVPGHWTVSQAVDRFLSLQTLVTRHDSQWKITWSWYQWHTKKQQSKLDYGNVSQLTVIKFCIVLVFCEYGCTFLTVHKDAQTLHDVVHRFLEEMFWSSVCMATTVAILAVPDNQLISSGHPTALHSATDH